MGTGKRKEKEEQRMVTFSKRRKGLFKKAQELHCLTGADIVVVAFSATRTPTASPPLMLPLTSISTSMGEKAITMPRWLEGLKVKAYESVDDLVLVKNLVEEIRNKVLFRVLRMVEDFVGSLLA